MTELVETVRDTPQGRTFPRGGRQADRGRDDPASVYRRTLQKIEQLHVNLRELENRCHAIAAPPNASVAISEFKRLTPQFEEVLSFIAVIETHTGELEEMRRREVEAQLALLRRRLAKLHVATAEPLLQQVEDAREPLALGTRHVMERWLAYLDQIAERLATGADAETVAADLAAVERLRVVSRSIGDRSPELPDFSDPAQVHSPDTEAEAEPSRPLLRGAERRALGGPQGVLRFGVQNQGGRLFIDPRVTAPLMVEVRRMNLQLGLASALGVTTGNLVMVLNGRDPISGDRLNGTMDFLKKSFGENRVELVTQ
ncbi:MAG TPA: hypothetical protein VEB20_14690 [Azospirillaceae bacterium]|nr:hypothetical protein [Azospirillaceae bacterium]